MLCYCAENSITPDNWQRIKTFPLLRPHQPAHTLARSITQATRTGRFFFFSSLHCHCACKITCSQNVNGLAAMQCNAQRACAFNYTHHSIGGAPPAAAATVGVCNFWRVQFARRQRKRESLSRWLRKTFSAALRARPSITHLNVRSLLLLINIASSVPVAAPPRPRMTPNTLSARASARTWIFHATARPRPARSAMKAKALDCSRTEPACAFMF